MLPSWLTGKSVAKLKSILSSGGGGGGSTVVVTPTALTGNEVGTISVDGVTKALKSGEVGDTVEVTQVQQSGAKIATISVNSLPTDIYAPSATGQVQADWTESDSSDPSYIKNKPTLATVATSGDYDDLTNKPTIPAAQVQADWTESDSSDPSYIKNKPTLATVATSGDYDDLTNKPTIPAAQVQSDWTESDSSDPAFIKNKPSLATVATSGDYDDLTNKPTIPAAQVQADWSESDSSDPSYIQNKPTIPAGIPSGGTTGQVLTKDSSTDYDVSWTTPSGGGATALDYPVSLDIPTTMNIPTIAGTTGRFSSASLTPFDDFITFLNGNPSDGTYIFKGVTFTLGTSLLKGMTTAVTVTTVSGTKRYGMTVQGIGYYNATNYDKTYLVSIFGEFTYNSSLQKLTIDGTATGNSISISCLG